MIRLRLFAMLGAVALTASTAHGVLVNQYTFNDGSGNDTGSANQDAVIANAGGFAQFVGGQLDLRGNNNIPSSAADVSGAYVDLPNGIATSALQAGQANAASFEMWVTIETNRFWGRLFDFGTSNLGEGGSDSGGGSDYLMLVSQGFGGGFAFESHPAGNAGSVLETPAPLATGIEHHIVVTYDQNNTSAGPGGTANVYLNNTLAATGPINPLMLAGQLFDENNDWLGRSQYGADVLIDGLYNEFRVYDHVLTAGEVAANFTAGPVEAPLPKLVVDRDTGVVTLQNQSASGIQITGYSISSAAGALNVAPLWDPIAPASGWTIQTQTATELEESGGAVALASAGGSVSIGNAWIETPIQDLVFSYTLNGGATGLGEIEYVGNGGVPFGRSDFDADGAVDVDDWVKFLDGNGDSLTGLSEVAQYLKGDLNGDDANNHADFLLFRGDFIADNSLAAFAALSGVVPEPSSLALVATASLAIAATRSRRRVR
jgi:hypothetical protein